MVEPTTIDGNEGDENDDIIEAEFKIGDYDALEDSRTGVGSEALWEMLATAMNRERKRGITSAVSKLALLSALIDWLDHGSLGGRF